MNRRKVTTVFILLSLVSLFSDMAYEGARSVLGPYTRLLEGSLLVAGSLMLGELIGQLARMVSGGLLYRIGSPKTYWSITIAGYLMNLAAVPLLAFAGHWWEAFFLVVAERVGKGIRSPARDVILAETGARLGTARLFAVHELADQVGAVAGPAILAYSSSSNSLRMGLVLLAIPALLAIILLIIAYILYPEPARKTTRYTGKLDKRKHSIIALIGLSMAILPAWPVATYSLEPSKAAWLYSVAMLADAVAAILVGELGQRAKQGSFIVIPVTAWTTAFVLPETLNSESCQIAMAILWGTSMGSFEVLSRAGVAMLVEDPRSRSLSYGLLGLYTAVGMVVSGLIYGILLLYFGGGLLRLTVSFETLIITILLFKSKTRHINKHSYTAGTP